jgi:hypothetical protein
MEQQDHRCFEPSHCRLRHYGGHCGPVCTARPNPAQTDQAVSLRCVDGSRHACLPNRYLRADWIDRAVMLAGSVNHLRGLKRSQAWRLSTRVGACDRCGYVNDPIPWPVQNFFLAA